MLDSPEEGTMSFYYLEDYEVGLSYESNPYTVSKEEIIDFAKQWDPQPFHIDEEAAKESIYGGLIAATAHMLALSCKLSNQLERKPAAIAGLGLDELRIHRPLRAGDTIRFVAQCTSVRRSETKPNLGIVHVSSKFINQDKEIVFTVRGGMMIKARPEASDRRTAAG